MPEAEEIAGRGVGKIAMARVAYRISPDNPSVAGTDQYPVFEDLIVTGKDELVVVTHSWKLLTIAAVGSVAIPVR